MGLSLTSAVTLICGHPRYPRNTSPPRRSHQPKRRHNTDPLPYKPLTEKESFPLPPPYIDTAALTGFPSPSSAYFSPQDPTIEFHPKAKRPKMGASHTSGEASAGFASPIMGSGGHDVSGRQPLPSGDNNLHNAASPRGEKRGTPDDTSGGVSGAHGDSKVTRRSRGISDPHGVGSSPSPPSAKDKAPSSPPPRGSRGSQRFSVPPPNGITPIMTSAEQPQAGFSAPALQTPNRLSGSILDYFPEQKRLSLASDRPAPTSPGPSSRRQSAIAEPLAVRAFAPNVIPPTPTTGAPGLEKLDTSYMSVRRDPEFVELKIQDFGYAENDSRRQYELKINLHDPPRPPSPAPPGFIPPMNMDEAEESEASSNFGFVGGQHSRADEGGGWLSKDSSSPTEDLSDDQPSSQFDSDQIGFTPGVYKALYPFEPEGSAEMALEDDQEVKCLGRGGGEGWLVAVKEVTNTGEVIHALVPEAYMQLIRPLEDCEMEEAMGRRS